MIKVKVTESAQFVYPKEPFQFFDKLEDEIQNSNASVS